jgi:UDP-galactopyranose mutase
LTYEWPCDYKTNQKERYYPVKTTDGLSSAIYNKYTEIDNKRMTFIGRCGTYQYLDMHQVINQSLAGSKKYIKEFFSA